MIDVELQPHEISNISIFFFKKLTYLDASSGVTPVGRKSFPFILMRIEKSDPHAFLIDSAVSATILARPSTDPPYSSSR